MDGQLQLRKNLPVERSNNWLPWMACQGVFGQDNEPNVASDASIDVSVSDSIAGLPALHRQRCTVWV